MRAISLWQPWATAIAVGNKSIETRHWPAKHRGWLAIHAARRWDADQREFAAVEHALGRLPKRLPLGAIVAIARLVDVKPTEELELSIGPIEKIYGNYGPGRYGWIFEDVRPLDEPIPALGRQSFFQVPDALFPPELLAGL